MHEPSFLDLASGGVENSDLLIPRVQIAADQCHGVALRSSMARGTCGIAFVERIRPGARSHDINMSERDQFMDLLRTYHGAWHSVDIRAIALFALDKWINLGTRLVLSKKPVPYDRSDAQRLSASLGLFREVHPLDTLTDLLSQLETGTLPISGNVIHYGKIENNEVKASTLHFSVSIHHRTDRWAGPGLQFPTILLQGWGEHLHNLLHSYPGAPGREHIDWSLRSLAAPYDGLDDLFVTYLEVPKPTWGHALEASLIEVVAPIQARLSGECSFHGGTASIVIEAIGAWNPTDLSIGVIAVGEPVTRASHAFTDDECTISDGGLRAKKTLEFNHSTSIIIFLRVMGHSIDTITLRDPIALLGNPRIRAYTHFDPELSTLREFLDAKGKRPQEDFEIAVALLLHFCGFNVALYGRVGKIEAEIDLIAFSPASIHVIAAECTTGDIDVNQKLTKLSRRVMDLRKTLPDFAVVPVLVTALDNAKITRTDLQKATNEGIGVAASEELKELLDLAGQQKPVNEVRAYLAGLIENQRSLFRDETGPEGLIFGEGQVDGSGAD